MAPNILDQVTKSTENNAAVGEEVNEENTARSRATSNDQKCSTKRNHTSETHKNDGDTPQTVEFKAQIRWPDLIAQLFIHVGSLYGLYFLITLRAKFYTYLWCECLSISKINSSITIFQLSLWFIRRVSESQLVSRFGCQSFHTSFIRTIYCVIGAHRLWSHKSYKAKLPLRALLIFLFTIAGQVW